MRSGRHMFVKINLFFLLMIVLAMHATAQKSDGEYEDVLYLKDGSVYRGTVTRFSDTIDIRTWSGLTIGLLADRVEKFVQEAKYRQRKSRFNSDLFSAPGMYHHISAGFSTGPEAGLSGTYVIGYRWNRKVNAGFGIGLEDFQVGWGRNIIPVFGEFRSFLTDGKVAPMVALRAGYGIALKNADYDIVDTKGGILIAPEFGFRFGGKSAHFTLALALHIQKADFTEDRSDWGWNFVDSTDKMRYQRFELRTGLLF